MDRRKLIRAALMQELPELVLKNAKVVNVLTGEIVDGDIAITDGHIAGVGSYCGKTELDLCGKYVTPGFINAHVHVESSMVTPEVYAMEELRHGTTTIITDPHEIANVAGMTALMDILAAASRSPVNYYVMLPSCVPCTQFEHAGAILEADELSELRDDPHVLGLGEMMNSVGVLACDEKIMDKLDAFCNMIIDGHAPMLSGNELNAYVSAGIHTDHESISFEEAREKLRCGLAVLIREGSASRNLDDIIKGVISSGIDTTRLAFCTDDKHLADIRRDGTIRWNIRRSIELGLDPIKAVQIGTINAARIYGLKNTGAVACGYKADLVVIDDLREMNVCDVYKDGINVRDLIPSDKTNYSDRLIDDIFSAPLPDDAFVIPEKESYDVIGIIKKQIVTQKLQMTAEQVHSGLENGTVRKIAVIERHKMTGFHACAYISGYGLRHGAIASTVAHDSHNIVMIGDNDADMHLAVNELKRIGGGYTLVQDGKVIGSLPLRLGGLMSLSSSGKFIPQLDNIIHLAYEAGVDSDIDPFITLSFMALPVIPEIRITDSGLFDVTAFSFI